MTQRPYSLFRRFGDHVVTSGTLGLFPDQYGAQLVEGGVLKQLQKALENAERILQGAGAIKNEVFKVSVYLTSLEHLADCNEIWLDFFAEPRPARTTIAVLELPRKALVEIELWAYSPSK